MAFHLTRHALLEPLRCAMPWAKPNTKPPASIDLDMQFIYEDEERQLTLSDLTHIQSEILISPKSCLASEQREWEIWRTEDLCSMDPELPQPKWIIRSTSVKVRMVCISLDLIGCLPDILFSCYNSNTIIVVDYSSAFGLPNSLSNLLRLSLQIIDRTHFYIQSSRVCRKIILLAKRFIIPPFLLVTHATPYQA